MDNFQQIDPKYLALIQAGAGILAANNGRVPAGAAIGQGLLGGAGAYQEGLQNQQMMQMRNDQIDAQRQLWGARAGEIQAEAEQRTKKSNALNAWKQQNPNLANLADIDFNTAYKAANPKAATENPYFQFLDTGAGFLKGNVRTGDVEPVILPDGTRPIKAASDPNLQGNIAGIKSYSTGLYDPTDMLDGTIMPKSMLSIQSGAPLPSLIPPNAPKKGDKLPSMVIPPAVQKGRDDKRLQILLAEQQADGGAGMNQELDKEIANVSRQLGIKVPTKAQEAGAVEQAKITAKAQAESALDLPKVINQGEQTIQLVDDLLKSTGFKTAVGLSSKLDPRNYIAGTNATDFKIRLDQLKGQQFLQAFESLKGGGQITEVEGKKATDAISRMNTAQSESEFIKAANEFKGVIQQGVERARQKAGGAPSEVKSNVRKYNPKTGKIE